MSQATYTKEELEEYRQVFVLFDTDGSGAIGSDELGEAMRSMGMTPTEKELDNLIKEVDVDGNGNRFRFFSNKRKFKEILKKLLTHSKKGLK